MTYGYEEVLRTLEEVVQERGKDFVYTPPISTGKCVYLVGDQPSCGVGIVLHRLGVSVEELAALDAEYDGAGYPARLLNYKQVVAEKAARLLGRFQEKQD